MSVITTVPRPIQKVNKLSDGERRKMSDEYKERQISAEKLSPYFLQEISDRLYGPDSDAYIQALKELNLKFKSRGGRTGPQIYRDEI